MDLLNTGGTVGLTGSYNEDKTQYVNASNLNSNEPAFLNDSNQSKLKERGTEIRL